MSTYLFKISVIVPIYNVEHYLAQCLNSIIGQSYTNLEIILIDDGSTDDSAKISKGFAAKDDRIRFIQQKNGGVSVARNTGIEAASGQYIAFVDSDDWLETNMYEMMARQIFKEPHLDMLMCDSILITNNSAIKATDNIREGFYSKSEIISELYPVLLVTENFGKIPIVSTCTNLLRKSILVDNKVRFDPNLRFGEDYLFMAKVMIYTSSFHYMKGQHFYNYRQYEDSRSKKFQPEWWNNFLYLNKKLKNLLENNTECDFSRQLKLQLIHSALFLTSAIAKNENLLKKNKLQLTKNLFNDTELQSAFSDLEFKNQSLGLHVVLWFMKKKMTRTYMVYRGAISKIRK